MMTSVRFFPCLALAIALAATANCPALGGMILSNFDTGAQGWTVGGGTEQWMATGGNPGGFLAYTDTIAGPPTLTAFAPAAFKGDLSAFDGGTISFDSILMQASGSLDPKFGRVKILNGTTSAELDLAPPGNPLATWSTYSATLDAADWGVSQSTWISILSHVTSIQITLESGNKEGESVGLDNVLIRTSNAVPEPSSLALTLVGFGAYGTLVARRWRSSRGDANPL